VLEGDKVIFEQAPHCEVKSSSQQQKQSLWRDKCPSCLESSQHLGCTGLSLSHFEDLAISSQPQPRPNRRVLISHNAYHKTRTDDRDRFHWAFFTRNWISERSIELQGRSRFPLERSRLLSFLQLELLILGVMAF
jgi:hypothetical protein